MEDGTVVISPEEGKVRVLNEVAALIWESVDGCRDVGDIAKQVTVKYNVPIEQAERDVETFLITLVNKGLLLWNCDG